MFFNFYCIKSKNYYDVQFQEKDVIIKRFFVSFTFFNIFIWANLIEFLPFSYRKNYLKMFYSF